MICMAHHQMTLDECILVAATGSDGKPPVHSGKRDNVKINELVASKAASSAAETVLDIVENERGSAFTDVQWEQFAMTLEADFEEAIKEAFGDL